ncbi:MAG: M16 family metallopeptidase [Candidatus Babeliales bacterium]
MKKFLLLFSCIAFQLYAEPHVFKKVLDNGLTILVRPVKTSDKVSLQMWYNVGSKHEQAHEKGLAHLIEHMIFGGTEKLSEADLPMIVNKVSGFMNAATSFDYTHFYFNTPKAYWKEFLPIMADCMSNCTFNEDKLNAELKVVIQELKMYKDHYLQDLTLKLITAAFPDHPYHYPVIGYKQDLWNLSRESLINFYKTHYGPNNATLVVVGDVDIDELFALAELNFGSLKPLPELPKNDFYVQKDLESKTVALYRAVKVPQVVLGFSIPGLKNCNEFALDLIHTALADGKDSRLHKKLVDELKLVTSIDTSNMGLIDYNFFYCIFEPCKQEDIETIIKVIEQELLLLAKEGISLQEYKKTRILIKSSLYRLLESNHAQAKSIAYSYIATGDEEHIFKEPTESYEQINDSVKSLVQEYMRPILMHKGYIFPLPEEEKRHWLDLQELSDKEDARILQGRIRETELQAPKYVHTIDLQAVKQRTYIKPVCTTLSNDIKVFYHHNANVPKITVKVEFEFDGSHEPDELPGIFSLLIPMIKEGGTENYTAEQLAYELESRGMELSGGCGFVTLTMLAQDLEKGLEILQELLMKAKFEKNALAKVKDWVLADIIRHEESQQAKAQQLMQELLYKGHPFAKNSLGTVESIQKIKRKDIIAAYKNFVTPCGAKISAVGDLTNHDLPTLLEKYFGTWQGPQIQKIEYPALIPVESSTANHYMDRDQIVLVFAAQSVDRYHEDFDKLVLAEQIISSWNSIFFQIREKYGIFYSIHADLLENSGKQPGYACISTKVSKDRLEEAKKLILATIQEVPDSITQESLQEAKNMILNGYDSLYARNSSIANIFLVLDRYDLPHDYFEQRYKIFEKITVQDVQEAVKKILDPSRIVTIQVGRV